jgi:hypothetical protein
MVIHIFDFALKQKVHPKYFHHIAVINSEYIKTTTNKDAAMKFNYYLLANLHNFISAVDVPSKDGFVDDFNIDSFGVGAVMPQDMPTMSHLTDTESYGV